MSKGEGSLEDVEPDRSTKSNLWSDAPFMSLTTLSRIVRGGVMLLQSRAVSHDRIVPTDRFLFGTLPGVDSYSCNFGAINEYEKGEQNLI